MTARAPSTARRTGRKNTGPRKALSPAFTLVELLVASVVMAVIAGAITAAVSNLLRAKTASAARQQAFARADLGASRIALDAVSAVRDPDLYFARVVVTDGGGGGGPMQQDGLLFLSKSLRPVRGLADIAEGGDFEIQYRIDGRGPTAGLWRRADPAFDAAFDGGGVASLLSPGVVSFSVEATDGEAWFEVWDSDFDGLPHALRVTLVARSDDGNVETAARRVVALDRTPVPFYAAEESPTQENGGASSGTGSGEGSAP